MTHWLPKRILPVLMYHRLGDCPAGDPRLWVSIETFSRHLQWIQSRGLQTLSLEEAYDCFRSRSSSANAVLITFDDAFAETLKVAAPLLQRHGMHSTVFVPAGLLGEMATLKAEGDSADTVSKGRIVDEDGLREWVGAGQEVGSHSLSHRDLATAGPDTVRRETEGSKRRLEQVLDRPVLDFCYPFAHHNAAARRIVSESGYRAAYAGEPPTSDLFALPRMMIYPNDSEQRFARKLSGFYYWISAWHDRLRLARFR